jgi:rubrerythrin
MALFRKGYEITLNRVHDTVSVREGDEKLVLTVNGDAMRMVAGLTKAQKKMQDIAEDATDEQVLEVAEYFATVIFGKEQATKLLEFYANDPASVINVCGKYFKDRLALKIADVQKKIKV